MGIGNSKAMKKVLGEATPHFTRETATRVFTNYLPSATFTWDINVYRTVKAKKQEATGKVHFFISYRIYNLHFSEAGTRDWKGVCAKAEQESFDGGRVAGTNTNKCQVPGRFRRCRLQTWHYWGASLLQSQTRHAMATFGCRRRKAIALEQNFVRGLTVGARVRCESKTPNHGRPWRDAGAARRVNSNTKHPNGMVSRVVDQSACEVWSQCWY